MSAPQAMPSKFETGKKIGAELLEDMVRDVQGKEWLLDHTFHATRYFTLINECDLVEFSGFLYGAATVFARHPIILYRVFHNYELEQQ
jgi:hypothetical protein